MAEYGYGKKNLVKWLLIYLVVGAVVYAAVWYFFLKDNKGSGYNYSGSQNNSPSYNK